MHGAAAEFDCGIWLPDDAIIDSSEFCRALIAAATATGLVQVHEHCSRVVNVETIAYNSDAHNCTGNCARTTLANGQQLLSHKAVIATGGHYFDAALFGILSPCWSYLVSLADSRVLPQSDSNNNNSSSIRDAGMPTPNSPNFYTWNFTHDWATVDGRVRISGEDHYSALKPPRAAERCRSLASWGITKYPYLAPHGGASDSWYQQLEQYYAVYTETPDSLPLFGLPTADGCVCYLVGCNAWGQASLSYCASLVPGVLGFDTLQAEQQELYNLVSISRFVGQPALQLYQLDQTTSSTTTAKL
jgi:glycine/D-amino acid oxidase-like deaminating enzyme